jgi:hypothetical protein
MAIHKGHFTHDNDTQRFFGKTSFELEKECQMICYKNGNTFILLPENITNADCNYLPSLDAKFNGQLMDIRSITEKKESYRNALKAKNKQIGRYNHTYNENADTVMLYFHDVSMFSETKVISSMNRLLDYNQKNNYATHILHIICVLNNEKGEIIKFDF